MITHPIGIDLGLTRARAAWVDERGQVALLETASGRRSVPAVVGIDARGNIHVGESARNQHLLYPERTATRVRRLLGTSQRVFLDDKSFSAHELCAIVLGHLRDLVEQRLGHAVGRATIAVPCYFTPAQRQAIRDAAALAGWRVVKLVLEPVAVALAYGVRPESVPPGRGVLVFDLGGRACEVAILERPEHADAAGPAAAPPPPAAAPPASGPAPASESLAAVAASPAPAPRPPAPEPPAFAPELGGWSVRASAGSAFGCDDCDVRIIDHLLDHYEREYGLSPRGSRRALARLKLVAEWTRHTLARVESTGVRVPGLMMVGQTPLDLQTELSREQLELLIEDDIKRVVDVVELAVRDARLALPQLHAVLLSGGGAQLPLVGRLVSEALVARPLSGPSPEDAIARGAALFGTSIVPAAALPAAAAPAPEPSASDPPRSVPEPPKSG